MDCPHGHGELRHLFPNDNMTIDNPTHLLYCEECDFMQEFERLSDIPKGGKYVSVGDRIVSTCGSLYRGCEGIISEIHPSERGRAFDEYSVTIFAPSGEHACHFHSRTQFVRKEAYLGREQDKPCQGCCCRMGGHHTERMP